MKRKRRLVGVVCAVVVLLVAALLVAVLVFKVPGAPYTVDSDDMWPALERGQTVLVQDLPAPARNDIVAYRASGGSVKTGRVAAVAGEWVNVASDGSVVASQEALEGNSSAGLVNGEASVIASRQVPEGACFVMPDNGADAIDALYQTDSYVSYSQILGRVALRIWPLSAFGAVS